MSFEQMMKAGVLGVATPPYLLFNFFCWISPIVALAFGAFNLNISRVEDDPETHLYQSEHAPTEPRTSATG